VYRRSFTLVELVVVMLMVFALAALALQRFGTISYRTQCAAAATTVRHIQEKIVEQWLYKGKYPDTIEGNWFADGQLPENPLVHNPAAAVQVDATGDTSKVHPNAKVYVAGSGATDTAFWYNPANGMVRARVPDAGSTADTLKLYNYVNHCKASSLAEVTQAVAIEP